MTIADEIIVTKVRIFDILESQDKLKNEWDSLNEEKNNLFRKYQILKNDLETTK